MIRYKVFKTRTEGFTLVEIVVAIAMMTIVSGIVLINFSGFNTATSLTRSSRELALAIRRAQNLALAVRAFSVGDPPSFQIPPAVGIRLTRNQNTYTTFGDLAHPTRDFIYTNETERIGPDGSFPGNIIVKSLKGHSAGFITDYVTVHIIFASPEADVAFTDAGGSSSSIGDQLDIELAASDGQTKTITVRTSGQISIR